MYVLHVSRDFINAPDLVVKIQCVKQTYAAAAAVCPRLTTGGRGKRCSSNCLPVFYSFEYCFEFSQFNTHIHLETLESGTALRKASTTILYHKPLFFWVCRVCRFIGNREWRTSRGRGRDKILRFDLHVVYCIHFSAGRPKKNGTFLVISLHRMIIFDQKSVQNTPKKSAPAAG